MHPISEEISVSDDNSNSFYNRVINCTNEIIDEKYLKLLKKGAKFNINPTFNKNCRQDLIIDLEMTVDDQHKYKCAKFVNKSQWKPSYNKYNTSDQKTITDFRQLILKGKNIVCTKADKGNSIVLLYKQDYLDKMYSIIADTDTFKELENNPTDKFQKETKEAIKKAKTIDKTVKNKLTIMNTKSPQLYGLTKIHKENHPMRPVVSYINAPSYSLAKYINTLILQVTGFKPKYGIKNSIEFCNNLRNQTPPDNSILVSFDVKSLFTNIPVNESIQYLKEILDRQCNNHELIEDIINLVNTCLKQSYFCFEDKHYEQTSGLPMGNPLSPILADIFMDKFETKLLALNNNLTTQIHFYQRYVDDIFFVFKGTARQLSQLLKLFNSQHRKIQFTSEVGESNSLNFLDINIQMLDNKFIFQIYRKLTYTDNIIPADSHHPITHKMAAFNSMIHRLFSIPLNKDNYNKEVNTIKTIARNNGYSNQIIINKINRKIEDYKIYKYLYSKPTKDNDKMWRRMLYIDDKSANFFKQCINTKFKPAYYTNNSIKKYILNNKSKINILDNSGVYKVQCNDCDAAYIGQSGRKIRTRAEEHVKAIKNFGMNSEMADHRRQTGHSFDINSFKVLDKCDKGLKLDILENLQINKHNINNNLVNIQIPKITSPLLKLLIPPTTGSVTLQSPPPLPPPP
jgi:hypothetical protein